jgi:hypothetical protein
MDLYNKGLAPDVVSGLLPGTGPENKGSYLKTLCGTVGIVRFNRYLFPPRGGVYHRPYFDCRVLRELGHRILPGP